MSTTMRDKIKYFCQQKGMTEEQLADEINKVFEQPTGEELIHVLNKGAAIGRREMLDKVCKWLDEEMEDYIEWFDDDEDYCQHHAVSSNYDYKKDFIKALRKAMETAP